MNNWSAPQRPNDYVEQMLVKAILDGTFAPGTTLPGERTLAAELGITRPTLREAIQRLARDGWLKVQHGKATQVNEFWREGGLNVLSTMVQHSDRLPADFVLNLLEVRLHLAPAYTAAAVAQSGDAVAAYLLTHENLPDTPAAYATFDWKLHRQLTVASGNPIFTLILNGFADFYEQIAQLYFAPAATRSASREFYRQLGCLAAAGKPAAAGELCRTVMQDSIGFWQRSSAASL